MSRPPNQYMSNQYSDPRYHPGETIDFKMPAIGNPYDPEFYPSIYAQAGFPGYAQYQQQLNAGYMPTYSPQSVASNFPQGYPQNALQGFSVGSPYQGIQGYPQPIASPASLPVMDSEAVQERIRKSIDAIMEAQKTVMLNSKLETLTNKVQNLAQNIESVQNLAQNIESSECSTVRSLSEKVDRLSKNLDGDSASHIKSLSDKVERLSRNIESRASGEPRTPIESLSSTASDGDIARKLRRLAAESAQKGRSEERIPDW